MINQLSADIKIDVNKLKFYVAYHNHYKRPEEVVTIAVTKDNSLQQILKPKDTLTYTFKMPKYTMKNPGYFKIAISENNLQPGMNGDNIKLTE